MAARKTLAAVMGAVVVLAACSSTETTAPPGTAPEGPASGVDTIVDWADPVKVVELDGGWTVRACEGDGPFLCVARNGTLIGSVEAAAYPVASFSEIDPSADDQTILREVAAGFQAALGADRSVGCGAGYRFDPIAPASFVLGGAPGLAYGFSGTMADGRASELNLQYSTIRGDQIVSIVAAAYDEGGCPGRDDLLNFDSAALAEFRPLLESVLRDSPLPDLR